MATALAPFLRFEARLALRPRHAAVFALGAAILVIDSLLFPVMPPLVNDFMIRAFHLASLTDVVLLNDYMAIYMVLYFAGAFGLLRVFIGPAEEGELDLHPAAERVARDRELLDPVRGEPGRHRLGEARRRRLGTAQRRRVAEPRKVGRDHLALGGEQRRHRRPHAPVRAERVQQHQRRAGPSPVERERRGRGGGDAHAVATLRSGSRAGVAGRHAGLANSACASPIRCSAKPASQ